MKNNTTKLLVILAVLLGVFLIVRFTNDSSRSKSFRSALVEIDTAEVTMIEIISPDDSVSIYDQNGKWTVNGKNADPKTLKSLLSNLQNITPARIASRSEDEWGDFQVDDQGTRVRVYEGDDKTLDIILGRFDVEGQRNFYSYVRLDEDEDTYVAKDFMKMSVGNRSADYRQDDVLRIKPDSLASIDFEYADSAFSLYKVDGSWQLQGTKTDSVNTAQYLRGLGVVTSKNFAEEPSNSPVYNVVYNMRNGESIEVSSYDDNVIGSSYNEGDYWQDISIHDKIFKGKSYFTE